MKIHGKEYTEVKDRIPDFLAKHPKGSITAEVVWNSSDFDKVVFRAIISTGEGQTFTGYAYEERVAGSTEVNASSWVENCETSAIGRALANMNIGVSTARPSAEEMKKVERFTDAELVKRVEKAIADGKDKAKIWKGIEEKLDSGELTQGSFLYLQDKYFRSTNA